MSFPSDSLPAPRDFLALLNILLYLLLPQGQLFSSHSASDGQVPGEEAAGGAVCPQLSLTLGHAAVSCTSSSLGDPLGSFQTKILSDAAATALPQWLFLAEARTPACESALTHSTYFSRLHRSVKLNETLNYQTSKLGISKRDKWMSCIRAWLCNPSSAEHLLLGTGKTNRLRNKEAT